MTTLKSSSDVSPVVPGSAKPEIVIAKDQPEYLPLPAMRIGDPSAGVLLARWRMSWRERIRALFSGDVYVQIMTFGRPVQPLSVSTEVPEEAKRGGKEPKR